MADISIGTLRGFIVMDDRASSVLTTVATNYQRVGKQLDDIAGKMAKHGAILSVSITAPIVAMGKAAIDAGTDYIQTMNRVAAVTDALPKDFKRLQDAAVEWGQKTQFSASEAASAMLELGKAGFTTDQTIAALPSTLQLAASANMSLGDAANLTANVMKTFGLQTTDLAHANDILAEAANSSTIDVVDLREALKYVGPVASQTGTSLSETSAAMALMGEAGIKGSMAGTALRNTITTLISPTKKQAELMQELGLGAVYSNGKLEDLSRVIDTLRARGANTAQIMELFGDRAGPAMAALVEKGGLALRELTERLDHADGAAKRMADASMKGLPGALEMMRGSIETARTAVLTALEPALIAGANAVGLMADFVTGSMVPAFQSMPEPLQFATIGVGAFVAAAGPLLLAGSALVSLFSTLTTAVGVLAGASFTFGNSIPILTARIWLMEAAASTTGATIAAIAWPVVAIAATGMAVYRLSESMDELTDRWEKGTTLGFFGKGGGFWDHSFIGDLLGMSKATQEVAQSTDTLAESYKRLKERLTGALDAKNVEEMTRVVRDLSEQGLLSQVALEKVGAEAVRLRDAGAKLTPELSNIAAWFERAHPPIKRTHEETDEYVKQLQKLKDKLSGAGVLTLARQYETVLKEVGGATKLTTDEQDEMVAAFDAVIAKYRRIGGAEGNAIVSHFMALSRSMLVIPPQLAAIERGAELAAEDLAKIGKVVQVKEPTLDIQRMALSSEELHRRGLHLSATVKDLGVQIGVLPNVTSSAKDGFKGAGEAAEKTETSFSDLATAIKNLAQVSGDSWGGIAQAIGTGITAVDTIHRAMDGFLKKDWKGQIGAIATAYAAMSQAAASGGMWGAVGTGAMSGALIGSKAGPVGTLFGAGIGAAAGFVQARNQSDVSTAEAVSARRDYIAGFRDSDSSAKTGSLEAMVEGAGNLARLMKEAGLATSELDRLMKLDNADDLAASIADIERALGNQKVSMETLDATTQKYGFTLEEMGNSGIALKQLDEMAQTLFQDFSILTAGGIESGMVVDKMSDSINEYVHNALRMGADVPEAMRPMIERLIAVGQLTDEDGNKIESLEASGITFTESMSAGFSRVVTAVEQMTDAIARGLGIALEDTKKKSNDALDSIPPKAAAAAASFQGMSDTAKASVTTTFGEAIPVAVDRAASSMLDLSSLVTTQAAPSVAGAGEQIASVFRADIPDAVTIAGDTIASKFGTARGAIDSNVGALESLAHRLLTLPDGEYTVYATTVGGGADLTAGHGGGFVTAAGIRSYHQGGEVERGRVLPFMRPDEVMAKLLVGESVLTPEATEAVGLDAIRALNRNPSAYSAIRRASSGRRGAGAPAPMQNRPLQVEVKGELNGREVIRFVQKAINEGQIKLPERAVTRRTA